MYAAKENIIVLEQEEQRYEPLHVFSEPGHSILVCPPALMEDIGRGPGLVLCQLAYWINRSNNLEEGRYWIYKTYDAMRDEWFSFWKHPGTVKGHVQALADSKEHPAYIEVSQLKRNQWNHVNHYTLTQTGAALLAMYGVKLRVEIWEQLPATLRTENVLFNSDVISERDRTKRIPSIRQNDSHRRDKKNPIEEAKRIPSHYRDYNRDYNRKDHEEESDSPPQALKMEMQKTLAENCDSSSGKKKKEQAIESLIQSGASPEQIPIVISYIQKEAHYEGKPHYSQVAENYLAAMTAHQEQSTFLNSLSAAAPPPPPVFELSGKFAEVLATVRRYILDNPTAGAGGYWNLERCPGYDKMWFVHCLLVLKQQGYVEASKKAGFYKLAEKGRGER